MTTPTTPAGKGLRRHLAAACTAVLLAAGVLLITLSLVSDAQGQQGEEGEASFEEAARVTAIDLAVAVESPLGGAPARLAPGDLVVVEDGEERPVVGVAPLGSGEGEEPWRLVLYFDLSLAPPGEVQAAALALGERAETLVSLGQVEVVVADPAPRPLLNPTRDRSLLENALARVVVEHPGQDSLNQLRRAVLSEAGVEAGASRDRPPRGESLPAGVDPGELAAAATAEELDLVHRSQDALLTWAAAEGGGGPKALLLVAGGYDLDPGLFYRRWLPGSGVESSPRQLAETTTRLARSVAGYGWLVYPLVLKQAASGPGENAEEFETFRRRGLDGPQGDDTVLVPVTRIRLGKGKKEAEGEGEPGPPPVLLTNPAAPLRELATASDGEVVAQPEELDDLMAGLDRRFRVTFQVSRSQDGRLHPVEVKAVRGGLSASAPAWVRSATPEAVAEARVRRMLAGWFEVGDLALVARFERQQESRDEGLVTGVLTTRLDLTAGRPEAPDLQHANLRLTIAYGSEEGAPSFQHQVLEEQDLSGAGWSHEKTLTLPADGEWIVVLVEELASGTWGAQDLEP